MKSSSITQATAGETTTSPAQWIRLKEILGEALEQTTVEARTAFVLERCAGDPELLAQARALLMEGEALLGDSEDALEECANSASAALARNDPCEIGQRLGAYVIVRKIGDGGMGMVYLAARADGYFEKEVAIKVLRPGSESEELLRRFRSEREVLARMEHPNIARLIDAGATESGLPYVVMEYIDGMPITRFAREKHKSIAERLRLFLKITAAVETAHRNGVIHRDLKPGNILVNRDGEPKLLDFGIAKLMPTDDSALELTGFGQHRFTPICASPEQAKGEPVTVASDVYALGVILYELLTDTKPFLFSTKQPARDEIVRAICEQNPTPPSMVVEDGTTRRALRGDLDAITLRALQKDPAKRYGSVNQFADDVKRYLASNSGEGRERDVLYRLSNAVSRNRWVQVGLIAICLGFVAAGISFFRSSFRNRVVSEKSATESAPTNDFSARAIPKKSIAVLPFENLSSDKENSYFADGVQDDILTALAKVGDLKVIGRHSASEYRGAIKDIPQIRRDLGVAYVLEGSAQKSADRVRVNARLIDTDTKAEVWAEQYDRNLVDIFAIQNELAHAIVSQLKVQLSPMEKAEIESRPTADMAAYDLYLRARESFYQNNWPNAVDLLEKAVARDPQFAVAYSLLAQIEIYIYRFAGSRSPEQLERARQSAERALSLSPELPDSHLAKAQYYYYGLRDYADAWKELHTVPAASANQATFLDLAALIERRMGRWNDAIRDGQHAIDVDPQDPVWTNELVESYIALRRFGDAEQMIDRATQSHSTRHIYSYWLKSDICLATGRIEQASVVLEPLPRGMVWFEHSVKAALFARDFASASQLLEKAASINEQSINTFILSGVLARAAGDRTKAESAFQVARDRAANELKQRPDDPELIANMAVADAGLGHREIALSEARHAVELCPVKRDAIDGPVYQTILAQVYAWTGDRESALSTLEEVVKLPAGPTFGELRFSPAWDEIRTDSRFDKIVKEASLPTIAD